MDRRIDPRQRRSATPRLGRYVVPSAVLLAMTLTATGCAASGNSAGSSSAGASAPSSAGCVPGPPSALPQDPDHVVEALPAAAKAALAGYPGTVRKSPWSTFTGKGKGPWKIGVSSNEGGPNAQLLLKGFEEVKAANPKLISGIVSVTASPANDVTTQIQQIRSLIQQHVDIILSTLSSPTALNGVIDEAAAAGIPVISIEGQSSDPNAVNIQPNPTQQGYYGAKGLVDQMGGKGNVLIGDAIPGLSIDTQVLAAGKAVFAACSGIKVAGQIEGFFDPATAKSETIKFLSTHPGSVDGVFQIADMAPGLISAFQQTGRRVPPVADIGASKASLAYWRDNAGKGYRGTAVGNPVVGLGKLIMNVGLGILQGRGLKVTDVPYTPIPITQANLDQWVQPNWTVSSDGFAEGPSNAIPIDSLLNAFFVKPKS